MPEPFAFSQERPAFLDIRIETRIAALIFAHASTEIWLNDVSTDIHVSGAAITFAERVMDASVVNGVMRDGIIALAVASQVGAVTAIAANF